jgi:tripartite-type tricarboxylate transporter receptor subunit TctC
VALAPDITSAQSYPNKVIRIATAAVGSANDLVARIIAQELTRTLGQQVIVENRGGLAPEVVARASPDGYTLLFYGSSVWLLPLMRHENYDPVVDLAPVTLAVNSPNVVVVHPSLPVKSIKELIALAKARPGELNYAAGTLGASPHLSTELFKAMAGINVVRVAYKGTGPSVLALIAGEVHMMVAGLGSVAPHMASGKLRALAVTSAEPSKLTPELPTVAASGVPGYEASSLIGMFAPAKTPTVIISRLQQETLRGLSRPEVKEMLFRNGIEVIGSSPEDFASTVKADMAMLGKVIREAGIRAD